MLNPKLFDKDIELKSTRYGFSEGLVLAADENSNVVGLCADLTESVKMDDFAKKYPERFVEMGIAEQSMASVASGMAAVGKVPFMASYAVFSPGRNWEQVRTTICYNNANVKIIGSHGGVTVGEDGGTHQALEDIALMRVLPNMTVIVPCDAIEAKKATIAAARTNTPVYIRLCRTKTPVITTEETPFEIGKSWVAFHADNAQIGIVATGPLLYNSIMAAKALSEEGIAVSVLNLATVKPLDADELLNFAKESGNRIVTVEEHQIHGGMGSAVAEFFAQNHPLPIEFVGVKDRFGQSGKPQELIAHYGLNEEAIKEAARKILGR
ncbi:MAG: transketolase C-terminal domain-containing protein [Candidatus Paceibacterota bacterium]|jgi:transketolase|nr:transketolase family protein [Candidatus Paceibacterota bacterium]